MKRIRVLFLIILAGLVWAALASLALSESPESVVHIEPVNIRLDAGSDTQITVEIDNVTNLGAFQFDLTFDPGVVQVDGVTLGDFPASTGRTVNPLGPKTDTGKIVFGAFSFGDAAGPDGSGTLARVTLKAIAGGETPLELRNVQVIDVSGGRIQASTQGATVVVAGPRASEGIARTSTNEPQPAGTAETGIAPSQPQERNSPETAPPSPLRDWILTGAALLGIIALVIVAARLMAR
ncbi:MAG: hypothetical protein D6791_05205 [Chloroflexi bacterium]|nr:MAG: hypothetical protein D6791_05205 [Chloroflexota bacterium]